MYDPYSTYDWNSQPNYDAGLNDYYAYQAQQQQANGMAAQAGNLVGEAGGAYVSNNIPGWLGYGSGGGVSSAGASSVPAFSYGAGMEPAAGFNLGGSVPSGYTASGGFAGTGGAAASQSGWATSGIGTAGNYYAPLAGAALGYDVLKNKKHGKSGAAEGAASGALIGTYFAPGIGTLAGAVIGGALGYFGNFGDEDKYKTEFNRAQKLRDKGVNWDLNVDAPPKGVSKDKLIEIARQTGGNVKFAESRNEKDLRPEDIWGYSTFGEKFGDSWLKGFSEDQRRAIANEALKKGAVREHTGTIDIDWDKAGLNEAIQKYVKTPSAASSYSAPSNLPPRSQTRSPGIDLQGNRINYASKKRR